MVNRDGEATRNSTTLDPIDGKTADQAASALKPSRKGRLPGAIPMKNRSANKSVDNTIIRGSSGLNELSKANADNTMKSSVDPEGTTQDSIAPTPFHH